MHGIKEVPEPLKPYKRRYNQIIHPATHNGHSYKKSEVNNQDLSLKKQLEWGIRATKLHIWYDRDASGNVVPFVGHGIDKSLLYNLPLEKILEQIPCLIRFFAKNLIEKVQPLTPLVLDAFHYAYGVDNATGAVPFRHCILDPAAQPLVSTLQVISDFLSEHCDAVITLILEDHTRNSAALYQAFEVAHLLPYLHIQDTKDPWPFLQDMIDSNKRLVIFVQAEDPNDYKEFPWMHFLWDYAWDTKWHFKDISLLQDPAYDTIPFRGQQAFDDRHNKPKNKMFIVHHYITDFAGGSKKSALKANKKALIKYRIKRLAKLAGQWPTIVQVDFFEHPDNQFLECIHELNAQ